MKRRAFVVGVWAVAEGYEEPALSAGFDAGVEQGRRAAGGDDRDGSGCGSFAHV